MTESKDHDHDLLIRIDSNLNNFMLKFAEHVIEDKTNFDYVTKKMFNFERILWIGLGVFIAVEFGIKIAEKFLL